MANRKNYAQKHLAQDLRTYTEICAELRAGGNPSLQKIARKLGMAPSSLSACIAQLEEHYTEGRPLISRVNRKAVSGLTTEGEQLYEKAKLFLQSLDEVAFGTLSGKAPIRLRIGASGDLVQHALEGAILAHRMRLRAEGQDEKVRMELADLPGGHGLESAVYGKCDIGFGIEDAEGTKHRKNLTQQLLVDVPMGMVATYDMLLHSEHTRQAIAKYPVAVPHEALLELMAGDARVASMPESAAWRLTDHSANAHSRLREQDEHGVFFQLQAGLADFAFLPKWRWNEAKQHEMQVRDVLNADGTRLTQPVFLYRLATEPAAQAPDSPGAMRQAEVEKLEETFRDFFQHPPFREAVLSGEPIDPVQIVEWVEAQRVVWNGQRAREVQKPQPPENAYLARIFAAKEQAEQETQATASPAR